MLGFTGLAQFSGSWSTTLTILPAPLAVKSSVLTLTYTMASFDITSTSTFDSSSFKEQKFEISGTLGAFTIAGDIVFNPATPKYKNSSLSVDLDFAGVALGLDITHEILAAPSTYGCQTDSQQMVYDLSAVADPVSVYITFVDCCEGIFFYDLLVEVDDISLCCGIAYDFDLYFTKKNGFEYVKFAITDLFSLCCGISFDFGVEFGVDYKKVSLTPKIDWAGECLSLGLEVGFKDSKLTEIAIDYLGITCEYGDCLTLSFGTEFIDGTAPTAWGLESDEYEYAKLSFCGPGCCGGEYTVDVSLYWQNTDTKTLFGLSRVVGSFAVPVMSNLTFDIDMEFDLLATAWSLDIGWTFSF
jgi:hypothetical protein